jgi:hypothetical protein
MLLYIIYTLILIYITIVLIIEFFNEKRWKMQLAMAFVLLIFILRILQIK